MKALNAISLKDNDRRAVLSAAATLRQQFPVADVVLYGSKARGDDDAESDIDLLVLTNCPVTYAMKRQMTHAVFQIQISHNVVLSMMIVDRTQWETGLYRALPIYSQVQHDGAAA